MINQCHFSGNLAAAPEIRTMPNGKPVASFRLAVNRSYKVGDEWKKETAWIPCVAYGALAESAADMPTGLGLVVAGYMKTEEWEKDGKKHSRLVLVIQDGHRLAPRPAQDGDSAPAPPPRAASATPRAPQRQADGGDGVPF